MKTLNLYRVQQLIQEIEQKQRIWGNIIKQEVSKELEPKERFWYILNEMEVKRNG